MADQGLIRARELKLYRLSRCENWTGHARKEQRQRGPCREDRAAADGQHRLRAGAAGADCGSGADPVLHRSRWPVHRRGVRYRPHQDRRFPQSAVPVQFQGIPAIRSRNQALSGGRIRRAGRGRGQNAAQARKPRKGARSRHRSAARRRHARPDFAVLGAPGAGARQAAGGAVPVGPAARRRLRQVHRDRQIQRDHPRQAVVRRRHAGADRAVARTGRRRQQQARQDDRRNSQVDGRGSRRAAASTRNCRAFPSCSSKSATRSSATG